MAELTVQAVAAMYKRWCPSFVASFAQFLFLLLRFVDGQNTGILFHAVSSFHIRGLVRKDPGMYFSSANFQDAR